MSRSLHLKGFLPPAGLAVGSTCPGSLALRIKDREAVNSPHDGRVHPRATTRSRHRRHKPPKPSPILLIHLYIPKLLDHQGSLWQNLLNQVFQD